MKRIEFLRLSLFIVLLFVPMLASFAFIHGNPDVLLRDVLFLEGAMLLIFGAQSGEYIWKFIRNWKRTKKEGDYPTELMVGLALLGVGTIYVVVAVLFPSGIIV